MQAQLTGRPKLRVDSDRSPHRPGRVSVSTLAPELVAFLRSCTPPGDLLKSIFRVAVAEAPGPESDRLPDVSGRYLLCEEEVQFLPHFPLERGLKYRLSFDPQPLGAALTAEPFD